MSKKFIKIEGSQFSALNGIYEEATNLVNGKKQFLLDANGYVQKIEWHTGYNQWQIISSGGLAMFVANQDTESPEDETNAWLVDSDNSGDPANITLTVINFPDLIVSLAGTTKVNDRYTVLSVIDNKPRYVRTSQHEIFNSVYINFNKVTKQWNIEGRANYEGGERPLLYESESTIDLATPDLVTGWVFDTGVDPLPVFQLASNSVLVCNVSVAVKRHRG